MDAAELVNESDVESPQHRWNLVSRIAFRFCFVYFSLFCVTTQILGSLISIPKVDIPELYTLWPIRNMLFWTASHLFGIKQALSMNGGSGDKIVDWVALFCYLVFAALATVVWSILDRRRANYDSLAKWFRLFLRFALVGQMMIYGLIKVFPMQMSYPRLATLLEPFGSFSPASVLWDFIGSSPAYEIICGSVELLCGLLLVVPRTALLGSLMTAAVAGQIFILNMAYDVPVKVLSFHLMLMALFLAAPELSRVFHFFLGCGPVMPSTQPELFRSKRANRWALWAQLIFGAWLLSVTFYGTWIQWFQWGAAAPKSTLYGIWTVDKLAIDGQERSPLIGDYGRWRRVVFEWPETMSYQRMDDTFGYYGAEIDAKKQIIALTKGDDKKWKGSLHYQRPVPDRMTLDGDLGGHPAHLELALVDRNKLMLVSRGFHWVQETPFYR